MIACLVPVPPARSTLRPPRLDDGPHAESNQKRRSHGKQPGLEADHAWNERVHRPAPGLSDAYTTRSSIIFLISAMAFAGFSPFGQVLVQFMIVWQR